MLILAPTRELAQQVAAQAVLYGRSLRTQTVCIYGGAPYPVQNRELARGVDILVATPGRLLDHLERGRIDLSRLDVLVLDEADRMLDMGFIDDVERIARLTPKTRQTVLFSATFDSAIARLAGRLLRDPVRIDVRARRRRRSQSSSACISPTTIRTSIGCSITCSPIRRSRQSLVFIATKRDAESLALRLRGDGHAAAALHGDMNQRERTRTLQDMRRGRVRTLVATDVAARGLDVAGISHVINFDLPRQAEDYVHRIGRTGRAGAVGIAVSLANHSDRGALRQIERYTGTAIPAHVIPGLEPRLRPARGVEPRRAATGKPAYRNAPRSGARNTAGGSSRDGEAGKRRHSW